MLKHNRMTTVIQRYCWMSILLFSVGCGGKPTPISSPATNDAKVADTSTPPAKPVPPKFVATDQVLIKTSLGNMTFELYGKQAPNTVANFLRYAEQGHFNGKIFHRVIDGFMIQGGGFDETLNRGETDAPIKLELIPGLKHTAGILSMARQPSDIHSATSQFFICVADAPQLNGGYAAFGKLISGEETLLAISRVATHTAETDYGSMNDVPIKPVLIETITRL